MDKDLSDKIKVISFLSIVLVVFLHAFNLHAFPGSKEIIYNKTIVWFIQDVVSFGFTRIAVPVFFIFSGFLFYLNSSPELNIFYTKIKKRFHTLFIPYLFWSIIGIILYFILQSIPAFTKFFTNELVVNYSFKDWILRVFVTPVPYQLWFIRDLMVMVLFSPMLYSLLKRFPYLILSILFFLWISVTNVLENSVEALFFFSLGGYLSMHYPRVLQVKYLRFTLLFLSLWIIIVLLKTFLVFYDFEPMIVRITNKVSIIIGIIALWGLYDVYFINFQKGKKAILSLSGFTFFIYAAHEPMLTIIKKILFIVLHKNLIGHLLIFFIAPVFTIILCLIVSIQLKKYLNRLYQIITGGR